MTKIDKNDIDTINHARKSLLFDFKDTWIKSENGKTNIFDVTMGSFDGAEVCEMVGLYILHQLKTNIKDFHFGLYRDDGLGYTENMTNSGLERLKKHIVKIFKSNNLKIEINMNMAQVDFLDVTFNISSNRYWGFRKPNNTPLYVNKDSNHPSIVLKQIPLSVNKRLNKISCDNKAFNDITNQYQTSIKKSGYDHKLIYNKIQPTNKNRQRKRKIIWFNPPFNKNIKNNIGNQFLKLLDKHFPKSHRLHKIINKHNVKLSYSCMPNIERIIKGHNNKIMNDTNNDNNENKCNCRKKDECPLNNNCLEKNIIYKATVTTNDNTQVEYIGSCSTTFKDRYANHKQSFTKENKKHSTRLSTYMWDEKHREPKIEWSIFKKSQPYRPGTKNCPLCLDEKLAILQNSNILNKKTELIQKCRHRSRYKLALCKKIK